MGFLDNTSVTVDAILTKKGRELLARGQDEFRITKYGTHHTQMVQTIMEQWLKICLY